MPADIGKIATIPEHAYYYRARYYDSLVGRFMSEDPIQRGGAQYFYANNNPIIWADASGLTPEDPNATIVANAIQNLITLLPKDPGCLTWLCSKPKNESGADNPKALEFLGQLLEFSAYGVAPILPTENRDGTLSIINGHTGGEVGIAVTINSLGAGFNSSYTSSSGKIFPLSTNNGRIPGGGNAALGFILLHELAHSTGVIAHDVGDDKAGRNNNDLIQKHCKTLIHLLGK